MCGLPVGDELGAVKVVKSETGEEVRDGVVGGGVPQRTDGQTLTADAPHTVGLQEHVTAVGSGGSCLCHH